ncbi:MAG TPA: hypothetical protein PKC03_07215 [Dokdonella sp.]|jgi:hypothetical protein|nr:hypothetical protein [Dokdonella sp.]
MKHLMVILDLRVVASTSPMVRGAAPDWQERADWSRVFSRIQRPGSPALRRKDIHVQQRSGNAGHSIESRATIR